MRRRIGLGSVIGGLGKLPGGVLEYIADIVKEAMAPIIANWESIVGTMERRLMADHVEATRYNLRYDYDFIGGLHGFLAQSEYNLQHAAGWRKKGWRLTE